MTRNACVVLLATAALAWTGGRAVAAQAEDSAPAAVPAQAPASDAAVEPVVETAEAPAPSQPGSTIIERVLVRVNGEILTQSELTQRQAALLREQQATDLADEQLQAKLTEITPIILEDAVDELLLVQRAREMGVVFSDAQFTQALENIKKQNSWTEEQLNAELARAGITREQLRQDLERTALVQAVQAREIGPSMTITQPEIRQYYKEHADQFMTPETVTLRQLLVAVPTRANESPDPAADAAVKARVEELRAQAIGGADFAQLVREHSSLDAAIKESGGLVGPVRVEDLNPALKEAILSLQPGEVSAPIRTQSGYQILKLETRTVPELRPFDAVRQEIESAIRNERIEPETEKMLESLRSSAVIEWKDADLQAMYEKHISAGTTASADAQ